MFVFSAFFAFICAASANPLIVSEPFQPAIPCNVPSLSGKFIDSNDLQLTTNGIVQPPNYKVFLDNCGRKPSPLPIITAPAVVTKPVESAPIVIPYTIPKPRTVSNKCKCVKTIVKPQRIEQVITVPVIKRYIQTLARPAYEVINYNAEPVNCPQNECFANC